MQYNKFIQKCVKKIKQQRQIIFGKQIQIQKQFLPQQPINIYLELIGQKAKKIIKLEQWNFSCQREVNQSQYGEQQDSQLDSINMPQKQFFQILTQSLNNISPKLLFKSLELQRVKIRMIKQEKQLELFLGQTTYLKQIQLYQTQSYKCDVFLKYDYGQSQQVKIMSSDQQFEILVDESYEKKKIRNREKQQRKFSQNIYERAKQNFLQPQTKNQQDLVKRNKKKQMITQIKQLIKIDQFQGKTLKQFISYLN